MNKKYLITLAMIVGGHAFGSIVSSSTNLLEPHNKEEGFFGKVEVIGNQFIGDVVEDEFVQNVGDVVGNQFLSDFDLGYRQNESGGTPKVDSLLKLRVNNEGNVLFSLQKADFSWKYAKSKLNVGRFSIPWSNVDTNWSLGKLNNRVNFDGFEPDEEGLLGVRYKYKFDNGFKFDLFGSVLYVPEINPGVKIDKDKGTLSCKNPWCIEQQSSAEVSGGSTIPIFYDVDIPGIHEIIFKESIGLSIGYEKHGWDIQAFYIRKPENQISTRVNAALVTATNQVLVEVEPEVYFHNVFGGEFVYNFSKNNSAYLSAISIRPEDFPDADPEIKTYGLKLNPSKIKEDYVGAGYSMHRDKFSFGVSYIARTSSFVRGDNPTVLEPRWSEAINMNLIVNWSQKFKSLFDIKYDNLTKDRVGVFKMRYLINKNLSASAGVNWIGIAGEEKTFWSSFANNDAVYAGMKLKF